MTVLLYITLYAGIACFVFGCLRRVKQYASLPVHLRWELYPVPHEPPHRAKHGGSYFEESEWWTKTRRPNRVGELRFMLAEILLFKSVREFNPTLWWRSLLFHSGLYCIVSATALRLLGALAKQPSISLVAKPLGLIGLCLTIVGALALLWRRVSDHASRDYTHIADYFHLTLISVTGALLFLGTANAAETSIGSILRGALTFDATVRVAPLLFAGLFLASALLAYIPFSQMGHFIAKYFTFHTIRWDDTPNNGGHFSKQINASLGYRPTWSASHINGDGRKTWAEIASTNPTTEARK